MPGNRVLPLLLRSLGITDGQPWHIVQRNPLDCPRSLSGAVRNGDPTATASGSRKGDLHSRARSGTIWRLKALDAVGSIVLTCARLAGLLLRGETGAPA